MRINEITLDKNSQSQEIIDYLNKFGVTVINNFIGEETINSLKLEFEELQICKQPWALKTEYSKGRCCRVNRLEMNSKNFPSTASVFGSEWMENICNRYLGDDSFLNHEIFLVNDVPNSSHVAQDLHYDRIPTLKFFIYLTNTTSENGSFYCVPGSQINTKTIEQKNRKNASLPDFNKTRDNAIAYKDQEIPIEGKSGTLIIFDTDVLHRAGKVSIGERYVMRGHTRKDVYAPNFQHKKKFKMNSILKNLFKIW